MSNLLVTGALGHIGSKLIRSLPIGLFDRIFLVDNLATQRYFSLFNLDSTRNYVFLEKDLMRFDISEILNSGDSVIHLAAMTQPELSCSNKNGVHELNVEGTARIAEACVKKNSKLLFISTTSIYGGNGSDILENCPENFINPQTPYAASKLQAEQILLEMGIQRSLKYVVCRFGTIFGFSPGMRFHTAVNRFVWQACLGLPLTVWRSALEQKRPYLDLNDAVNAMVFLLQNNCFDNEVYNVVTLNTSVSDIVNCIRRHIPDTHVDLIESDAMNDYSYTISSKKISSLGFAFEGNLEHSIVETIKMLKGIQTVQR